MTSARQRSEAKEEALDWLRLGRRYLDRGDIKKAREFFGYAKEIDPETFTQNPKYYAAPARMDQTGVWLPLKEEPQINPFAAKTESKKSTHLQLHKHFHKKKKIQPQPDLLAENLEPAEKESLPSQNVLKSSLAQIPLLMVNTARQFFRFFDKKHQKLILEIKQGQAAARVRIETARPHR